MEILRSKSLETDLNDELKSSVDTLISFKCVEESELLINDNKSDYLI